MKRMTVTLVFVFVLAAVSSPAYAWKLKTHAYIANIVMDDAKDGKVWIPPYGEFEVRPEVAEAIKLFPQYFRGGSIGPDGFPDFWTGQSFIHPNTNPYLVLLWDSLPPYNATPLPAPPGVKVAYSISDNPKRQAWAFTFGYFSHCASDMWAHDWVNTYAGKAFPGMAEIKADPTHNIPVIARHISIENTLDKRITLSDNKIDIPNDFVINTLILNRAAISYGMNPVVSYFATKYFEKLRHKNEKKKVLGVETPVKTYDAYWFDDLENGFKGTDSQNPGWMESNKKAIKGVMEKNKGMIGALGDYLGMWSVTYFFDMLGAPSVTTLVGEQIAANQAQIDWALDAIGLDEDTRSQITSDFVNMMIYLTFGMDKAAFDQIWTAEMTRQLFPGAAFDEIMADMGNPPSEASWKSAWTNQTAFNNLITTINGPLYNSVITTKIAMLKPSELERLIGKKLPGRTGQVVILDVLRGIDFSKQFAAGEGLGGNWLGYGMNLAQLQDADWRPVFPVIFKPYGPRDMAKQEVWSSSLDANHRWAGIYPVSAQMLMKPPTLSNIVMSQFNPATIEVEFRSDRAVSSACLEYTTPANQAKTTAWVAGDALHGEHGTAYGLSIHEANMPNGIYKIKIRYKGENGLENQTALTDFSLFGSGSDWGFTATPAANNTYVLTWNKYPRSGEFQKYVLGKGDQFSSSSTQATATYYDADQMRPHGFQPITITSINTTTKTVSASQLTNLTLTARSKRGNFLTNAIAPTVVQAQATTTTQAATTQAQTTTTTSTQATGTPTTSAGTQNSAPAGAAARQRYQ